LQPKLLRALQERAVRPIGGKRERPFSARLVAATNKDLELAVAAGTFREDLYYRIQVVQLDVPALRYRGDDVLMLAHHFIKRFAAQSDTPVVGLRPSAAECLTAHSWPGNVRELSNCIERAVTLCRYSELTRDDLPRKIAAASPPPLTPLPPLPAAPSAPSEPQEMVPMEEVERQHVLRVFAATGRNKSLTAKILSLNRKTLYRKLRRYGAIAEEGESVLHGAEQE
jgi:two-component system response regulator HydG